MTGIAGRRLFNEYIKMIGNAFGYNGPEAKGSLEQIKRWFRR
ncbi:hypothetical protein ACFTAO_37275 [Paenibacillus rhizoplanae]